MKKVKTKRSPKKKQVKKPRFGFLKFVPALAIALFATFVWAQPKYLASGHKNGVLSYATDTSIGGLLSSTNSNRNANGVASLSLNSKLNASAQAKANDMANRDYWSHQTPEGQQPWIFFTNAGYSYLSAGENLAYGFSNSASTVTGWMNSPSHKANMLSATFTEVGFGIANSANYVGSGPQTVVVAHYGKPQVAAAATPAPTPTPAAPAPTSTPTATKAQETPTEVAEDTPPAEEPKEEEKEEPIATAITEENTPPPTAGTAKVQRIQLLTGGNAIWSATFVVLAVTSVGVLWALHHGFKLRRYIRLGENFITHHLHLDLTVLAVIYLGFVLMSTSGVIR